MNLIQPTTCNTTKTPRLPTSCPIRPLGSILTRRIAFPLFLLGAALIFAQSGAATPFQWDFTGNLNVARYDHTATLLANGMVLVAGGFQTDDAYSASAELYDPATGSWSNTGSLNTPRVFQTATLLPSGLVLVAGGATAGTVVASAELYNPASGTWSATGNLNVARSTHMAALLPNGMVLVAGGGDNSGRFLKSAELYDPATGTWTLTGSLNTGRLGLQSASTLLSNGTVLVAGGTGIQSQLLASAEVYDPASGSWSLTGSLHTARAFNTTTLLTDGRVVVAGGDAQDSSLPLASAEVYDPAAGTWSITGSLNTGRTNHTATLLPDGEVLVAGGFNAFSTGFLASAELYDPASGTWSLTGSLKAARTSHTATLLANGMVLAAAGRGIVGGTTTQLNSAELYDTGTTVATMISGRGTISGQGDQATFNFHASQSGDRPSGSLSFSDPTAGISIAKARIRTLTFNGNSADLGGNARLGDGTRVTYSVSVTDNSSDGSTDTFSISLSNGYSAGGTLTSGDIQIQ